jgi:hypothetical protein
MNVELQRSLAGAGDVEIQLVVGGELANPLIVRIK